MKLTLDFKKRVIAACINKTEEQLRNLKSGQRSQIEDAEQDDSDSTSIAESTREQQMSEAGQLADQSDFISRELEVLRSIQNYDAINRVKKGALVRSNVGYFLIGPALEQISFEGAMITGISEESPLYKKMESLKEKAEFHFGNREYIILEIV